MTLDKSPIPAWFLATAVLSLMEGCPAGVGKTDTTKDAESPLTPEETREVVNEAIRRDWIKDNGDGTFSLTETGRKCIDAFSDDTKTFTRVDELPDDPLAMPPPYWRSSGAIFHVLDSLEALVQLLSHLLSVNEATSRALEHYFAQYPQETHTDEESEEFGDICQELWEIEHKIKLRCETATLMSAISAEDKVNEFCVFNLPKSVAEPIEKLPLGEKLLIASCWVGKEKDKSNAVFEAIGKLTAWRNAFAHGHCVDRPLKSLRHNHLVHPPEYPGVPYILANTAKLVSQFVGIPAYLAAISVNRYTAMGSTEIDQIQGYLREIARYRFEGDNNAYNVSYESDD